MGVIRNHLRHLHNGKDIIVSLACHPRGGYNFSSPEERVRVRCTLSPCCSIYNHVS